MIVDIRVLYKNTNLKSGENYEKESELYSTGADRL